MSQIAATIVGKTFHHEERITIDQVFKFYDTVCLEMNGQFPTYLFLTAKDEAILSGILQLASAYPKEINAPMRNFLLMHVVVLPTLPENTLIIGQFVLHSTPQNQIGFLPISGDEAVKAIQELSEISNTTRPEGLD